MGITASENFSSKSVNFAVSKSVRRGLRTVNFSEFTRKLLHLCRLLSYIYYCLSKT